MPSSRHLDRLALADYALPASITERLFSPALVVFLDHVRANVQQMVEYMGGEPTRWRPHVKTTKTPVIWRELVNAGVRHFKCAIPREAEYLVKLLLKMAVEAGKDVYCEKPMGNVLEEANAALKVVKSSDRVVQIGTQRRSDPKYRQAARLVQQGLWATWSRPMSSGTRTAPTAGQRAPKSSTR